MEVGVDVQHGARRAIAGVKRLIRECRATIDCLRMLSDGRNELRPYSGVVRDNASRGMSILMQERNLLRPAAFNLNPTPSG
jgi:hypothetical protein